MLELKFYKSPWKAIRLILLSLPFVIFSLYSIITHTNNQSLTMNWFCLCFFGLSIPIGLFNLLDKRPELIINNDGIFDRMTYGIFNKKSDKGFVGWDSIEDAYLKEYQNYFCGIPGSKQITVCIKLDKEAKIKLNSSKAAVKISKSFNLGDYNIPLINLKKVDGPQIY